MAFDRSLELFLGEFLGLVQPGCTIELGAVSAGYFDELGGLAPAYFAKVSLGPWKGQLREMFRPVVLCTAESLDDPRLLELAIQIPLIPTRNALPQFDLELAADTSKEMRARLHQYREKNLAKVRTSQFDAPEFSSPTREIAASLGSCIVDDTELQARVIGLLRDQEQDSARSSDEFTGGSGFRSGTFPLPRAT